MVNYLSEKMEKYRESIASFMSKDEEEYQRFLKSEKLKKIASKWKKSMEKFLEYYDGEQ